MFEFLALITNKKYWFVHSYMIAWIFRLYGIKVGRKFYCEGIPLLKIRGKAENIVIGDNVSFLGSVDLRNRENGKITIEDHAAIEGNVRLVSAREGHIKIGRNTSIGSGTIMNGGGDILIGEGCLISARVSINANEHQFLKDVRIKEQGYELKAVIIEDDCLLGVNVAVNKGTIIKEGSIIGANSVVTKDTEAYSINIGSPAKKISERRNDEN